jgi:hypothetical protein
LQFFAPINDENPNEEIDYDYKRMPEDDKLLLDGDD